MPFDGILLAECSVVVMRQASIWQPRDFDRCPNKYSKGHGHPAGPAAAAATSRPALARSALARAALATGVAGSLALLPLAWAQGSVTRRRVPLLPPAKPPYHGWVPGIGDAIRVLAIGKSTVSGVGLSRSDETVAATTAQALARLTGRPAAWRACGLTGATVRDGLRELVPRMRSDAGRPHPRGLLRQRRDRLPFAGSFRR